MSNPIAPPRRRVELPPADAVPQNLKMEAVGREAQVAFATVVPESFREEFEDLRHAHRLNMREMIFAMTAFWRQHLAAHPDFNPRSFRISRSRKL